MPFWKEVFKLRNSGGIFPYKLGFCSKALRESTTLIAHYQPFRLKEIQFFCQLIGINFAEWGNIINNNNSPTVGAQHQVVGSILKSNIVYGHWWQVVGKLTPGCPAVVSDVQSHFCS